MDYWDNGWRSAYQRVFSLRHFSAYLALTRCYPLLTDSMARTPGASSQASKKKKKPSDGAKKRGRKSKWSPDRVAMLEKWFPSYVEIGGDRKKSVAFWKDFLAEWFSSFPYHDKDSADIPEGLDDKAKEEAEENARAEAQKGARGQLANYFNHRHTQETTTSARPFQDFFDNFLRRVSVKPKRELPWQVYMSMTEHSETIKAEGARLWEAAGKPAKQQLKYNARAALNMYGAESADVREEIEQRCQETYDQRVEEWEKGFDRADLSDEAKQEYRTNLVSVVEPMLSDLLAMAGLTAGVLLAARPPTEDDDDYDTIIIPVGQTIPSEGSLNFEEWKPKIFEEVVVRHFLQFVSKTTEYAAHMDAENDGKGGVSAAPLRNPNKDDEVTTLSNSCAASRATSKGVDELLGDLVDDEAAATAKTSSNPKKAPRGASKKTRTAKHQSKQRRRPINLDDRELTGSETESSSDEGGLNFEARDESDDESSGEDTTFSNGKKSSGNVQKNAAPEENHGPEENDEPVRRFNYTKDWRGRVFGAALRDRINRMPGEERAAFVGRLTNESHVELARQDAIAKSKAELEKNGSVDTLEDILEIARAAMAEGKAASARRRANEAERKAHEAAAHAEENRKRALAKDVAASIAKRRSKRLQAHDEQSESGAGDADGDGNGDKGAMGDDQDGDEGEGRIEEDVEGGIEEDVEGGRRNAAVDAHISNSNEGDPVDRGETVRTANHSTGDGAISPNIAPVGTVKDSDTNLTNSVQSSTLAEHTRSDTREAPTASQQPSTEDVEMGGNDVHDGAHTPDFSLTPEPERDPLLENARAPSVDDRRMGDVRTSSAPEDSCDGVSGGRRGAKRKSTTHDAAQRSADAVPTPEWVAIAHENFGELVNASVDGAAHAVWRRALDEWLTFEQSQGFEGNKNLPTGRARPAEIGLWIKSYRVASYTPKLPEDAGDRAAYVDEYKSAMRLWWSKINPKWRARRDELLVDRKNNGSWVEMHFSGVNGLQSLLKGLHWWFTFERHAEGSLAWLEVARDVEWALHMMNDEIRQVILNRGTIREARQEDVEHINIYAPTHSHHSS
ncbi:hypothetical protein BD626DRAFT_579200 [Schizophyllum amplum]|uniref:Uncharacterized protein n=1 Tax=Schizophyllum amplum TaxID=97359 RepID=A0A550BRK9_9AGAR|nr:hypothetical protein BD626DRAFT_579200 [Auriculariopsis ampla]